MAALLACTTINGQEVTGDWYGTLTIGSQKLALVFHIAENEGVYTTVMDSPDQHAEGLTTTATTFDGTTLTITATTLGMTYEGSLVADSLTGTFRQNGLRLPLTFTRRKQERARPQTPRPPYPYTAEEVVFDNPAAGIALAGTLTLPAGEGPFPAVVLVTGSGAQNRDEELFGHKPFLVTADYLTRRGIAVLRYDDRGTAASEGNYASATLQDLASDAACALRWLAARPETGATGIIGHSEGGIIAYMLAGGGESPDFIVSMAGPAVTGTECLRTQRHLISRKLGLSEEAYRQNELLVERVTELTDRYAGDYIETHLDSLAASLLPPAMHTDPAALEQMRTVLAQAAAPEMVSLRRYDPTADLARIACPLLAIVGEKDTQVPPSVVEGPLREGIAPNTELTIKVYPGLNHLFQHAATGLPSEYGAIEETLAPDVLADMAAWVLRVAERR